MLLCIYSVEAPSQREIAHKVAQQSGTGTSLTKCWHPQFRGRSRSRLPVGSLGHWIGGPEVGGQTLACAKSSKVSEFPASFAFSMDFFSQSGQILTGTSMRGTHTDLPSTCLITERSNRTCMERWCGRKAHFCGNFFLLLHPGDSQEGETLLACCTLSVPTALASFRLDLDSPV